VVLGVVVTFIGQALTRRQTSALSIAEQKAALRNDRREAIFAFIDIARTVYVIAQQREEKGAPFDIDDKVRAMDHQLWFSAQCIDVLCTDEFRTATEEYTSTLYGHLLNTNFNTGELSDYELDEETKWYELARNADPRGGSADARALDEFGGAG
jgi:hypothetical protein